MDNTLTTQRGLLARPLAGLFVLLCCVYLLTYSGYIETGDTLFLFNGVSSLVRYGDWGQDLTAFEKIPTATTIMPGGALPIQRLRDDPLSVLISTPLYWLAAQIPGIGLVHTVWLLNVVATAAAGCVLYVYALTLGYEARVGLLAALLFGLATAVWPYSKTFFQESLTLLITLTLALALERWRRSGYRQWLLLLLSAGLLLALYYSKWTAVIALPGLLLLAVPTLIKKETRAGRFVAYGELALLAGLALVVFLLAYSGLARYLPIDWFNTRFTFVTIHSSYTQVALQSYLFSIGASIWGTSPVLLLALPGAALLMRRRQSRYVWALLGVLLAYALGYALLRGMHWFSGLAWPPRFLVPTIGVLMLSTLPVLDIVCHPRAWTRRVYVPLAGAVLLLAAYGLWIQLSAVSFRTTLYPTLLPPDTGIAWGGGMNSLAYLRWVLLPSQWGHAALDFAWARTEQPVWLLLFGVLGTAAALWLARQARRGDEENADGGNGDGRNAVPTGAGTRFFASVMRCCVPGAAALLLALLLCTYAGLRLIYNDPEYYAFVPALFEMLPLAETETQPGDVVLVTSRDYVRFLLNYSATTRWRGIGIPYLPGERYTPNGAPLVSLSNPANPTTDELRALLPAQTPWLIEQLAATRARLWLWAEFGPDMPWTVRPLERYLTRLYYPLRELRTAPAVRLLEYALTPAPTVPEISTNFMYGEQIALAGFSLARGDRYMAGDTLLLSLYWQARSTPQADVTVALFLANAAGGVVAQGTDSAPEGGFARSSLWQRGMMTQDNRALRIPPGTPAGEYRLWLTLYRFDAAYNPLRLAVRGGDTREEGIAVLPVTIRVEG
ncbi:MAG: hypothetical protein HXY40_04380 [Chloroflexi bacterium]|nr:hypothetical protein [Chloroflexota bacterium]